MFRDSASGLRWHRPEVNRVLTCRRPIPRGLEDFTALVATFARRMYGIRSKAAKLRLLVQVQQKVSEDDR